MSLNLWGTLPAYLKKASLPPNKNFGTILIYIIESIQAIWKNTLILQHLVIFSVPKKSHKNDPSIQCKLKLKRGLRGLVLH